MAKIVGTGCCVVGDTSTWLKGTLNVGATHSDISVKEQEFKVLSRICGGTYVVFVYVRTMMKQSL